MKKTNALFSSGRKFIPVCEPLLTGDEYLLVKKCLKTNWISSKGDFIKRFEESFSRYCDMPYGVSCSSGTAALHLALCALEIKKGDEVIIPSFAMIAVAAAVCYTGAKPVLVDSDPDTGNIDSVKIEEKISKRTRAIIAVHTYGHPCDMDAIDTIAKRHRIFIIEDAAEAHGALYKKRKAGSLADLACFSFYANKIITTGEGGMVLTRNKAWAQKLNRLKDHYFGRERFIHEKIGFNYRMTNIQAAIGVAQLKHINRFIALRRAHASLYNKLLRPFDWIQTPIEKTYARSVYWMYAIRLKKCTHRLKERFVKYLCANRVDSRIFFVGMHLQPALRKLGLFQKERYPNADLLSKEGLYLPSGSGLAKKEIHMIVSVIKNFKL